MKQRERFFVREQTVKKDNENSRNSMQLYLNFGFGLVHGKWTMQSCSKDLREAWASRRRSMEKIRCFVNTAADTRERFILEPSGQKYRKEILPLEEQVLARRSGARVNEHHRAIREMDNHVNQHIEMPQISVH